MLFALSMGGLQEGRHLCDNYMSVHKQLVVTFHSVFYFCSLMCFEVAVANSCCSELMICPP